MPLERATLSSSLGTSAMGISCIVDSMRGVSSEDTHAPIFAARIENAKPTNCPPPQKLVEGQEEARCCGRCASPLC